MRYNVKPSHARLFGLDRPVVTRACDSPGCTQSGEHRAPKSRDKLNEYYWFCLDHVRAYNAQWDYYAGMNESEIESHIRSDYCWQRETWPMSARAARAAEDKIRETLRRDPGEEAPPPPPRAKPSYLPPEILNAFTVLDLTPPLPFVAIRARYKEMVKKHHPDTQGGSREAEEKFKRINEAYALLRQHHEMIQQKDSA